MYRDAVPDPMDITKFEWQVIPTADHGGAANSVTTQTETRHEDALW